MSNEDERTPDVGRADFDQPFEAGPSAEQQVAIEEMESNFERLEDELYRIRGELSRFEEAVDQRTVEKPALESELRRYVRRRMRRSRAHGWGPYLVLLYGTIMTVGAFYYLAGLWAILAMVVVWLSTLGLYVVMLGAGFFFRIVGLPFRIWDAISRRRSS